MLEDKRDRVSGESRLLPAKLCLGVVLFVLQTKYQNVAWHAGGGFTKLSHVLTLGGAFPSHNL